MTFETLNDALIEIVKVAGGSKHVGRQMRPELDADDAGRWLRDCLNPNRREMLSPDWVLWLLRRGRELGCHAAMHFIADHVGYSHGTPIEPDDEKASLQREFINAQRAMADLAKRMESVGLLKAVA